MKFKLAIGCQTIRKGRSVGVHKNKVIVDFGDEGIKWIGFKKESALKIANILIKCAQEIKEV